jgi:hypothetical protein
MNVDRALQTLCKWRLLFTGWQLGTRTKSDPEAAAVRDHREVTILLRAEQSALTRLLVAKGVFTFSEFNESLGEEAVLLNKDYEARFPGITASEMGLTFDHRAAETMKGWLP